MATLATGNKRLPADAGVSLVEAMVALLVISLSVGVVLLVMPGGDRAGRDTAERLAAQIVLAGEESVIANRPLSLVVTSEGYGFERLDEAGWTPVPANSPLGFRVWPDGLDARIPEDIEAGRVTRFDPLGGADAASILLEQGGAVWRVEIAESGEVDVEQAQ